MLCALPVSLELAIYPLENDHQATALSFQTRGTAWALNSHDRQDAFFLIRQPQFRRNRVKMKAKHQGVNMFLSFNTVCPANLLG